MKNPTDNELCDSLIQKLTTALHLNQFTAIGLNQTLNRFIAQKANRLSINHYDHTGTRYMEDSPYDDDPNINPQLTEKFFINSKYFLQLDSTNKKFDHIIDLALTSTKAYKTFFTNSIVLHFYLTFSHQKKEKFTANRFTGTSYTVPQHCRFMFVISKNTIFLNFTYCNESTKLHGGIRRCDPVCQI